MKHIIVEQHGQRELREFPRLFTVGRRPDCAVVVTLRDIAAVQVRVDHVDGEFVLSNLGKAGQVFVNGVAVDGKQTLKPRDEIEIGDARIILADEVIADRTADNSSVRIRCGCGAGLRVSSHYAGKVKHCPKCGMAFTVPTHDGTAQDEVPSNQELKNERTTVASVSCSNEPALPAAESTCPVCQCSVLADDELTTCPACGLQHHADCWNENLGCSAYGCSQVDCLKQGPDIRVTPGNLGAPRASAVMPLSQSPTDDAAPWEFALLGLSVLCLLIGTVTFGVPCLVGGSLIAAFVLLRDGRVNWAVLAFAGLANLVGLIAGIVISIHLYVS